MLWSSADENPDQLWVTTDHRNYLPYLPYLSRILAPTLSLEQRYDSNFISRTSKIWLKDYLRTDVV